MHNVATCSGRMEGEWLDGELHGHAETYAADGARYIGTFAYGMRHGRGMSRDADGSMYDGEWDSGERSGEGAWLAGEDYEPPAPQSGSMDHDEPHPPTVAPPSISLPDSPSSSSVYSSSTAEATPRRPPTDVAATAAPPSDYAIKYHGSWRGGKRAGHGTVFYRSGASYVPPTAPSGRCRHRKCGAPQASSRASVWRTHRLSPPPPPARFPSAGRRYTGTVDDAERFHGEGRYLPAPGAERQYAYTGQWTQGLRDGAFLAQSALCSDPLSSCGASP